MGRPVVITGGGTGGHVFPMQAIAEAIATNEFVGLGVESMDTMVASLKAVTLDTANAALRKYLDTSRAVTVLAGVNG